jgi:hypothetical protein
MRRAAVALALLGVCAVPALARNRHKKKRGKVVRVERSSGARGAIRMCSSPTNSATNAGYNASATCYGRPPKPGETGTVVDSTGVLGTVEIGTVAPGYDSCKNENYWSVEGTTRSGNLSTVTWQAALLFDYEPAATAKAIQNTANVLVPSQRAGETLMAAIDQDNDNIAELIITYYYCDLSGAVAQQGGGSQAYCMVYYQRNGSRYDELRIDVVKSCY